MYDVYESMNTTGQRPRHSRSRVALIAAQATLEVSCMPSYLARGRIPIRFAVCWNVKVRQQCLCNGHRSVFFPRRGILAGSRSSRVHAISHPRGYAGQHQGLPFFHMAWTAESSVAKATWHPAFDGAPSNQRSRFSSSPESCGFACIHR